MTIKSDQRFAHPHELEKDSEALLSFLIKNEIIGSSFEDIEEAVSAIAFINDNFRFRNVDSNPEYWSLTLDDDIDLNNSSELITTVSFLNKIKKTWLDKPDMSLTIPTSFSKSDLEHTKVEETLRFALYSLVNDSKLISDVLAPRLASRREEIDLDTHCNFYEAVLILANYDVIKYNKENLSELGFKLLKNIMAQERFNGDNFKKVINSMRVLKLDIEDLINFTKIVRYTNNEQINEITKSRCINYILKSATQTPTSGTKDYDFRNTRVALEKKYIKYLKDNVFTYNALNHSDNFRQLRLNLEALGFLPVNLLNDFIRGRKKIDYTQRCTNTTIKNILSNNFKGEYGLINVISSEVSGANSQVVNIDNFGMTLQKLLTLKSQEYDEPTFALLYDMYAKSVVYKKDGKELDPESSLVMLDIVTKVEKYLNTVTGVPKRVVTLFKNVTNTALKAAYIANKGGIEKVATSFEL
jgi:hypothetical protein